VKSSDRTILVVVGVMALIAAFWFLVLAPKRHEASDLSDQVSALESQVAEQEAVASSATTAKTDFKTNYRQLVTLGKAVPVDADTPSLLTQLQALSSKSNVAFQGIELSSGGTGTAAAAPTPISPTAGATATSATEATASLLPLGANIGPAGLPIMPYSLTFQGSFFDVADFFGRIDNMVTATNSKVAVNGRLLTIDDFTLAPVDQSKDQLQVTVDATSYVSPADQGTTAGATPTGPAAAAPVPAAAAPATTAPVAPAVVGN
jgi:Tfp pilus assembly protein PilO